MLVEENRLLPNAMNLLNEEDWKEMYEGDCEIGWMFSTPPAQYPPKAQEEYVHPSLDTKKRKLSFSLEDRTHFDEGYLTMEQVNFIFKFLPVDITYVDENDKVVFYNRGDDRVFPRSAGIIGREVKFCHPPKSVDQVLKILEEFKAGRQDTAEFWIEFKGKFIHIRYFAIRDDERNYKGVIEMSQDVTEIRALEGQKRLLDWNYKESVMTSEKLMIELFGFSSPTYYKWSKHEKRKIFDLINYAFSNNELEEFLKTGKISKIENLGNESHLLDNAIKFYKKCKHITNYKIAKNLLLLLEKNYKENQSVNIEKIAEDIYCSSDKLFDIDNENSSAKQQNEVITSMKFVLFNLIQKQECSVLEYICKNRNIIEKKSNLPSKTLSNKYLNKIYHLSTA
jgi:hypothetical protein